MQKYYTMPGNPPVFPPYLLPWPPLPSDDNPDPRTSASAAGSGGVSRTSILTPAIVASIALIGSAILLISYYRVFAKYCASWQHVWGLTSRSSRGPDEQVLRLQQEQAVEQGWFLALNSGLDESVVKRIPVYIFRNGEGIVGSHECSVCLGEFEDDDELRILPKCSHAFHLSCIDIWLQSHSNCPLCRAPVVSPRTEALLLPTPEQSISNRVEVEHPEEQQEQEQQVLTLQIEEPEQDTGTAQQEANPVLRRSRSLNMEHAHYNRKSQRWRIPLLRRSHSTGSNPINYQDLLLSYDPLSVSPANLIIVPNNSAELGKQLSNLGEDEEENYVVLNIEVASTSSTIEPVRASSGRPSALLSVRKAESFKTSLKRSFSGGRVFSFRKFARSRSHA